jgi:hypothetical protein
MTLPFKTDLPCFCMLGARRHQAGCRLLYVTNGRTSEYNNLCPRASIPSPLASESWEMSRAIIDLEHHLDDPNLFVSISHTPT